MTSEQNWIWNEIGNQKFCCYAVFLYSAIISEYINTIFMFTIHLYMIRHYPPIEQTALVIVYIYIKLEISINRRDGDEDGRVYNNRVAEW